MNKKKGVCPYEEWYDLTRECLYPDAAGTEQIWNAAEWNRYCNRQ